MKYLALLLLVVGCGKSEKAAPSTGSGSAVVAAPSGSWMIGGITVPESAIPQKVGDVPTVLPGKIGDELIAGDLFDMRIPVPDKVSVSYVIGDPPNDDLVRGYQVMIYADPLADLEAKWGPSTGKTGTSYDVARCWTAAEKQLETCVFKNNGQNHWYVMTVTTAPFAERAATPVAPEPAGTYADYPVEIAPCHVVGIGEVSEILGTQMQYFKPEPDDASCHLVPAVGKAASRVPGQVTASEAVKQVPDLLVMRMDAARASFSDQPIEALGEKAAWDGMAVVVQVKSFAYRIRVTDASKPVRQLKDRALQVARKVVARAQALPAE